MIAASASLNKAPWQSAALLEERPDAYERDRNGRMRFRPHDGQQKALDSTARFILILAGLQSGKTITGPWWLLREMVLKGPGDYLAAGPTFPLLKMKCLPEYETMIERRLGWGKLYKGYPPVLEINEKGRRKLFGQHLAAGMDFSDTESRIIFGAGIKPESLESATVKAAHLDEAGQKQFLRASHEAVLGRLSVHRGRVLYTTTPYQLGWLKAEVYDRARDEQSLPPRKRTYELVQYASTMNPAFPEQEFQEMQDKLPGWKFRMRYKGEFERPAGMIYNLFSRDVHVVPHANVPAGWSRFFGFDFGGVNTVAVKIAKEPKTNRYVAYSVYHHGNRTAADHKEKIMSGEPSTVRAVGGAPSEDQWRDEFRAAGLNIQRPPVSDVEVGIDRVYALLKNHPALDGKTDDDGEVIRHDPGRPYLEIMDSCPYLIDEFESYSRVLDEDDEPTEEIRDKSSYHRLDGVRYIGSEIADNRPIRESPQSRVFSRFG